MYGKDYATLEALTDKADPSRLRIDIQLQSPRPGTGLPDYEFADFQRAIREGFREALAGAELQRLTSRPQISRSPRGEAGLDASSPLWSQPRSAALRLFCFPLQVPIPRPDMPPAR